MTLYLKYRPKNLEELDLVDVGESLKKIVSKKSIPHAFLFAGPKGTGKTSAARILAKIVNCESTSLKLRGPGLANPCDECAQCISITNGNNLDVIEMDAASHRGIDDVRILRDAVKLSPVSAKKKTYIIDEAHMLTTEASNALLKTLEEPPDHVIFILATTNPEKLIDTIRSRTTFIPFKKATEDEIVRSLERVAKGEKIKMDKEILTLISQASDGSFRDGIKILEQLIAEEKELTKEFLEEYLFQKKAFDLDAFIALLVKRDTHSLIEQVEKLGIKGVAMDSFLAGLLKRLKGGLLAEVGIGEEKITGLVREDLIGLIDLFSEAAGNISESLIEELPIEIAIIKWCGNGREKDIDQSVLPESDNQPSVKNDNNSAPRNPVEAENSNVHEVPPSLGVGESVGDEVWKNILGLIKPINASIEALLRAARPISYDGKVLTLGVYYKFHKERLEDIRHRKILEEIVAKVLQSPTRVSCTLVDPPPRKIVEEIKTEAVLTEGEDKDIIKAAEEIFGN
jgi:DNA polymerase-3 subunit gamma/tau